MIAIRVEPPKYIMETIGRLVKERGRAFWTVGTVAPTAEVCLPFFDKKSPLCFCSALTGETIAGKDVCGGGSVREAGLYEKAISSFSEEVRIAAGAFRKKSAAGMAITKKDIKNMIGVVLSLLMVSVSRS